VTLSTDLDTFGRDHRRRAAERGGSGSSLARTYSDSSPTDAGAADGGGTPVLDDQVAFRRGHSTPRRRQRHGGRTHARAEKEGPAIERARDGWTVARGTSPEFSRDQVEITARPATVRRSDLLC
jgi:hypothetical protein